MEPQTDREWIMQVDSKVDKMCEAIERLADAVEKLETVKFRDHEIRITKVEKWVSEWSGAYKIIAILALIFGLIGTIKSFRL